MGSCVSRARIAPEERNNRARDRPARAPLRDSKLPAPSTIHRYEVIPRGGRPRLASPVSIPAKYRPAVVEGKLLAEAIDQLPTLWTAEFLIERVVIDRKDKREVETVERALDNLQRSGKVRLGSEELVEPIVGSTGVGAQ